MNNARLAHAVAEAVLAHIKAAKPAAMSQVIPADEDRDGRSTTAKAIKSALAKAPKNELKRHFSAAVDREMLKTTAEREDERIHTARAERALRGIGNRLSLSDPHGDILRKDGRAAHTAVDIIKAIHSRGPNRLAKVHAGSPTRVSDFPPQSENGHWEADVRADDGADLAHDAIEAERQAAGVRPKPTPATPPHSASMRALQALRTTADGGEDPTVTAIKVAQRLPRALVPVALSGQAQDPNRDDAAR
jgi:hypothetical protein